MNKKVIKESNTLAGNLIDELKKDRLELLSVVKMILWCKPHKLSLDALKEVARKVIEKTYNVGDTIK